jgi:hypothetical protein
MFDDSPGRNAGAGTPTPVQLPELPCPAVRYELVSGVAGWETALASTASAELVLGVTLQPDPSVCVLLGRSR